jgi:predicted nucleic acid-binding protein
MQYIDSNIFIYAVAGDARTDSKAAASKEILLRIAGGNLDAATS